MMPPRLCGADLRPHLTDDGDPAAGVAAAASTTAAAAAAAAAEMTTKDKATWRRRMTSWTSWTRTCALEGATVDKEWLLEEHKIK